jgi:hypothetical protein
LLDVKQDDSSLLTSLLDVKRDVDVFLASDLVVRRVIHQVAQAGSPEEPPKDEQAVLIHAKFNDSAGPEKAPFSVFPLL